MPVHDRLRGVIARRVTHLVHAVRTGETLGRALRTVPTADVEAQVSHGVDRPADVWFGQRSAPTRGGIATTRLPFAVTPRTHRRRLWIRPALARPTSLRARPRRGGQRARPGGFTPPAGDGHVHQSSAKSGAVIASA